MKTLQKKKAPSTDPHALHYIIERTPYNKKMISIDLQIACVLKNVKMGKSKRFNSKSTSQAKYLSEEDKNNLRHLKIINETTSLSSSNIIKMDCKNSGDILRKVIETNRCNYPSIENRCNNPPNSP